MDRRKPYWKALTLGLGAWLSGGALSMAKADTSASYEMEAHKRYGNCRVWTQMDMLTDEESHHLECGEETFTDKTEIGISDWGPGSGKMEVRLSKGAMFHLGDQIPVAIRIDKGTVTRRDGHWFSEGMTAIIRDRGLATSLMDELAKGQRVVIQVGQERGNIRLQGSAAAIKDFRERAKR